MNVSWEELLHERPSDLLYLRNLLDSTRTLNREYRKKKKPRTQISSKFQKMIPTTLGKSNENCTLAKPIRTETSEVKLNGVSKDLGIENENELRNSSPGIQSAGKEKDNHLSKDAELKNLMGKSWLAKEDETEENNR